MRTGIVVERVSGIVLGICNGVARRFVRVLVPAAVAHHDQVIRILSNRLHHVVGVSLDRAPTLRGRFIEYFKNDVIVLAPFLGHVAKECLCLRNVVGRLVAMVVDNHIDIVVDSRLHHGIHESLVIAFISKVIARIPVFIDTHRGANQLDVLVLDKLVYVISRPERSANIARNAPEKAHALHDHFVAVRHSLAGTVNLTFAAGVLASHQLTIGAYRAHTVCGESRRKETQGK